MQVFQKNSLFVSATFILFLMLIMQGNAESQGQTDCLITNDITITQQVSGEGVSTSNENIYFIPGKLLNITITFTKNTSESILALGLQCTVPQGWQYQGTSGTNAPAIAPQSGQVSDGSAPFEFAWITTPTFPFNFTFSANIPSDAQGPCQITTQALYRLTAGQICSDIAQTSFIGETTPQEGEGKGEGESEGEDTGCAIFKGCDCNSGNKNILKNVFGDFLLILIAMGTLGLTSKKRK